MKKHSLGKSISVYEKIFKNAWKTTWGHKELWVVGLLAGLAYSGTIIQNIFENAIRVRPADQVSSETLEQSVTGISYFIDYTRSLVILPSGRMALTIIATLILTSFLVYVIVTAQHLLLEGVHRAAKKKKHLTVREILRERKHLHFWRLFAVDVIIYILSTIITFGAAIPLTLLLSQSALQNIFVYIAMYTIILPLLFIINIGGMFSLVHVVRKNDGIDQAFKRAIATLKHHWLAAAEVAIVLLLINLIGVVLFVVLLSIGALILAPFFLGAVGTGSIILIALVGFMSFASGAVLYLLFVGAFTVFNYATWVELIERVERYGAVPALDGVLKRFRKL